MHTALEVEIDHGCLETRFAGAVDQVEPVRRLAEVPLNALDRSGYLLRRKVPPEPKNPSIPARDIASTISQDPMPLAIAPVR